MNFYDGKRYQDLESVDYGEVTTVEKFLINNYKNQKYFILKIHLLFWLLTFRIQVNKMEMERQYYLEYPYNSEFDHLPVR